MILHAKSFHNKDKIQRAKIGLQLFLSILIITSIILNVVVIITKSMPLIVVYMFTPAFSSILTRIILKEGFKDVSFSLGNLKIWKGIGLALLIPMIICGITYSIAWLSGIAGFQHPEGGMLEPIYNLLGLQYVMAPFSFIYLVVLSGIFGSLLNLIPVLGEEMGWRGYMLTRLVDAEFSRPILISGLVWATWHVPIVMAGLYVEGPSVVFQYLASIFVLCHSVILQLIYDLSQVAFGLRLSSILLGMPLFKDLSHVQVQDIKLRFGLENLA